MEKKSRTIGFDYPDSLVKLLESSGITIVISTYQAGKIMILGQDRGKLDIRYKNFYRPMGMCSGDGNLWAGIGHGIWHFCNFASAAEKLDCQKNYTACYMPVNIHFTGDIDIHEMAWADHLYYINTKFSCLCVQDGMSSFKPIWKPWFISSLQPTDKCHLNGLCLKDSKPRYVTALGRTDEPLGWRKNKAAGGLLMDITTNEILLEGLCMPHSPRWHQGRLWFLESGKGSVCRYEPGRKKPVEVVRVPGFTRGFEIIGDFALVGVSKVRESATFSGLPITRLPKRVCGVWIVNIRTGKIITFIEFTLGIDEIFSVNALAHPMMEMTDFQSPLSRSNYLVPTSDMEVKMPETPIEMAAPFFEKGNDFFNEGKKEKAVELFKHALSIQPDFLPAAFNMAIALGDLDRFEQAEKILLNIREKDASIVETYNSLGYVYFKKKDFNKARVNFEKAIELKPDYEQAKTSLEILNRQISARKKIP